MSDVTFKPSQVVPFFPNSKLQKGEKEVVAAMAICYLTSNGDQWQEMEFTAFFAYLRSGEAPVHPVYHAMCSGPFLQKVLQAIGFMVHEGFFVYRKDEQAGGIEYLEPSDKLLEFYKDYVKTTV